MLIKSKTKLTVNMLVLCFLTCFVEIYSLKWITLTINESPQQTKNKTKQAAEREIVLLIFFLQVFRTFLKLNWNMQDWCACMFCMNKHCICTGDSRNEWTINRFALTCPVGDKQKSKEVATSGAIETFRYYTSIY